MIKLDLPGWHAKWRDPNTGEWYQKPIVFAVFAAVGVPQSSGRMALETSITPFVDNDGELTAVANARIVRVSDA